MIQPLRADDTARPVTTEQAVLDRSVTRFSLTGSVTARRVARLSSRTSGLIRTLHVDAGEPIKSGQILMELDSKQAELSLELIRNQKRQAAISLADARRLVDEVSDLAKRGGFPRSEAESRITEANLREIAVRLLETREAEQADILDRHKLPAPFDGVIGAKFVEDGEWVETGTPVVELIENGDLRFELRAPQEMLAVSGGELDVSVTLDAHPNTRLPARVMVRAPVKDPGTRTFLIRLEIDDPGSLAAHGMSGTADFSMRGSGKTIQVSRDSIVRFPDGSAKVWVVDDQDGGTVVRSRVVRPGSSLGGKIEILEGLEEGERVVLLGNEGLREGQAVRLLPEPPNKDS